MAQNSTCLAARESGLLRASVINALYLDEDVTVLVAELLLILNHVTADELRDQLGYI